MTNIKQLVKESLTVDHLSRREKLGFLYAIIGTATILLLTVKASISTQPAPEIERQVFRFVFLSTIALLGGVLLSHYTDGIPNIRNKL